MTRSTKAIPVEQSQMGVAFGMGMQRAYPA